MKSELPLAKQVDRLRRRSEALITFGIFAFQQPDLQTVLNEAVRVCAECLGAEFSKICKFQPNENDLRVVAGHGWKAGVVGSVISVADETCPQVRAFTTGKPQLSSNVDLINTYVLPDFYAEHGVLSTVHVVVATKAGAPFGVLEVASQTIDAFDEHDVAFLTGFANMLAEAVATFARSEDLRRTNFRMEESIQEKETLSQELKHRVRNSLHLVYGLLTAELRIEHSEASTMAFRAIALRVMGLAQIFDHLLGVGMTKVINFGDYIIALCDNLPELYGRTDIRLTCVVEPVRVDLDTATALGIIITELVNNAYLHAFPNGNGKILVALRVTPDGASLSVADDGVGFIEVETKRRGVGLVRRLVQQVGGTLMLRSVNGSEWTIALGRGQIAPETAYVPP